MLKLLVVEDHALVREGLVRLLGQIEESGSLRGKGGLGAAHAPKIACRRRR